MSINFIIAVPPSNTVEQYDVAIQITPTTSSPAIPRPQPLVLIKPHACNVTAVPEPKVTAPPRRTTLHQRIGTIAFGTPQTRQEEPKRWFVVTGVTTPMVYNEPRYVFYASN
jgi:hypothetical protein